MTPSQYKMPPSAVMLFLLGAIVTADRIVNFEYIFQVNMKSSFQSNQSTKIQDTYMKVELRCQDVFYKQMTCYIKGHRLLYPIPSEPSSSEQLARTDKRIDYHAFEIDSQPFEINMSSKGIENYIVEVNTIPRRLMNVYRIITNPLNVGIDITTKYNQFKEMETSNTGICSTNFNITRIRPKPDAKMTITSFFGHHLWNQSIFINKQRNVSKCFLRSNYSYSAQLWPEFVPVETTSRSLVESTTSMKLTSEDLRSVTNNKFNLYDEHLNQVGSINETVALVLSTYRILPRSDYKSFENKKTRLLLIFNDDEA